MPETKDTQERIPDLAHEAESVIQRLNTRINKRGEKEITLTTAQIRKFLSAVNALTNKISMYRTRCGETNVLSPELAAEVKFLKVKLAYQVARNRRTVGDFENKANLMARIDQIGTDMKKYDAFIHFVEALVAYHKFHGGRD
ncbi:type III-A CRISPR-associated protein Csm2 [uncultured Selenomonas sp.]|uniref:type III-A CRISPR-associated protein Csm2 n=1 Tax=uncultured Selenomonas sp. TaxID=159275 RepID=UPI0028E65533|nr:type III-A CRISPR-associated protein Csm2 [uncultured Selenomonas sp.]